MQDAHEDEDGNEHRQTHELGGNSAEILSDYDGTIDRLIADIDMPSPQPHGIAVGNMGKMKQPGLKVIYITGNPSAIGENVVDRRETPLLGKPVPADALLSTVKAVLARDAPA